MESYLDQNRQSSVLEENSSKQTVSRNVCTLIVQHVGVFRQTQKVFNGLLYWTLSVVLYSEKHKITQRFENSIYFSPQIRGSETSTLWDQLEALSPIHCSG
jgi:hypothetical protein